MSMSRSQHFVRPLILAAAAALVLGMPVLIAAPVSAATSAKHKEHSAADEQKEFNAHLQKMTESLKLSPDQAAKVKAIMQDQMAQKDALRAKYKGLPMTTENKAAMQQAHKDLHADTDAKLAQVLTADQMAQYNKMSAERMKKHESAKEEKAEEAKESK